MLMKENDVKQTGVGATPWSSCLNSQIHVFYYSTFRQALNESKKQNHSLMERLQAMQAEVGESEVTRAELEAQIRQGHTVRINPTNSSIIHTYNNILSLICFIDLGNIIILFLVY